MGHGLSRVGRHHRRGQSGKNNGAQFGQIRNISSAKAEGQPQRRNPEQEQTDSCRNAAGLRGSKEFGSDLEVALRP
ncbi:MAG TPA: hypothetical protein PLX89_15505 [Verrucomicrobiota bacterium]|nr:hypothetical protein [Verrucomicrobiales bacterium]HRI14400.1 hypothetical protein [Verrucomicrobiota bacterium]